MATNTAVIVFSSNVFETWTACVAGDASARVVVRESCLRSKVASPSIHTGLPAAHERCLWPSVQEPLPQDHAVHGSGARHDWLQEGMCGLV